MKKKIAILFSGQIRENALGDVVAPVPAGIPSDYLHDILESYDKHFFTNEFKNENDYDIFISTDYINVANALDFFGKDNVKNIHLSNHNYYLHPIKTKLKSTDYYLNRMHRLTDDQHVRYPQLIPQYHKLAQCYEMLQHHNEFCNYDYIIRTRLDTVYHYNVNDHVRTLNDNASLHLLGCDDQYAIGRPGIMKVYVDIINNYCTYQNYHGRNNFKFGLFYMPNWTEALLNPVNEVYYKYSSTQLMESLYQYCDANNLDIDTSIKNVGYGIIRHHLHSHYSYHPYPTLKK